MDVLEREMTEGTAALRNAKSFPEAYYALISMEAPKRKFMTLATLCEAHNTMDTNDQFWAAEQAWFDQNGPRWEAACVELGKALNASAFRKELELHLGTEIFRQAEVTGRAFSTAITSDLERESTLSAQYSKISGNLSVELDGKSYTMGELSKLEKPGDRGDREKFGVLRQQAFEKKSAELDQLYDDLVGVRTQMAQKLGFSSYTDMGYCRQGRTGYQRDQVASFRKEIEKYYWDFHVTPDLLDLRNIATTAELIIDCSLARKESRGLHYNADYPVLESEMNGVDTIVQRNLKYYD